MISNDDRPYHNSQFFQQIPSSLLNSNWLTVKNVELAVSELVSQTRRRIQGIEIPFSEPRVIFTDKLPDGEPGHIEFGWNETIVRIHPKFVENPFALAAILCHELAHLVLDHNGIRKSTRNENERLTDFFVFKAGQGLIYLQGVLDLTEEENKTVEQKLGYLSLEEMVYAHVRCASQYGLKNNAIASNVLSGKVLTAVNGAIDFLTLKSKTSEIAEIILCPNNHVLRISPSKISSTIRCPKCKWQEEIWVHKGAKYESVVKKGLKLFDSKNFAEALLVFKDAQQLDPGNSRAFCLASRCLKNMSRRQDAIRELQKFLSVHPDDPEAGEEMKALLY